MSSAALMLMNASEVLNTATSDPVGAAMRAYQIYKTAQDPIGAVKDQLSPFIKPSMSIQSTTLQAGAYPNDSCAGIVVNAQNTVINTLSNMINGIGTKAQTGLCSFGSAFSESLGNSKFCTTPTADLALRVPLVNQMVATGALALSAYDLVVDSKATECKFDMATVTTLGFTALQAAGATTAQTIAAGLTTQLVSTIKDNIDASKAPDRIDQIQEANGLSVFSDADLADFKQAQDILLAAPDDNGGLATALSQSVDLALNTASINNNATPVDILNSLKTDLIDPAVTDILTEFNLYKVLDLLPLSSQQNLKTDVYDTYFGGYSNFSSSGISDGYDITTTPYYGTAPTASVTNETVGGTGKLTEVYQISTVNIV